MAVKNLTADLFESSPLQPVRPALVSAGGPPPRSIAARQPRPLLLWYAVVFPALPQGASNAAQWLLRLAGYAQQFTSQVSLEPPQALLLEVKGSLRLFGPLPQLRARIEACWRSLGVVAEAAVAPSALAALWLARAASPATIEDPGALAGCLARLPIAVTAWDAERLQALRAMGLTRLGELMRLPRAGLARRLGPSALLDLDMALARAPMPRRVFLRRERFRERRDFDSEIDSTLYLEKALEPLVSSCADFLRLRQAGVQALTLLLRHRSRPVTRLHVGLASVTSERRRLAAVLAQKLSGLRLLAPVRALELRSTALQALPGASLDAFAAAAGCGSGGLELVERLRARLGEQFVYGVCWVPEHRPEAAWRVLRGAEATRGAMPEMRAGAVPRPLWLLSEALPLASRDAVPLYQGDLALEQGPERIESGWWDGRGIARDYYVARDHQGARLWVYRERRGHQAWFLHGVFG
jgi:protein ImuB